MIIIATMLVMSLAADAGSPVERVVNMLRDMQSTLEQEKKSDQAMFDKMACWCKTNEGEKSHAVDVATQRIAALNDAIDGGVAKNSELQSQLQRLGKDIQKNQKAVQEATALRNKENAEFSSEEAELLASLDSVSNAVSALSKHNFLQSSFLQTEAQTTQLLKGAASLGAKEHSLVKQFLRQPADFQSYNSRSGAIFGILSQMKETFEQNIAQARKDEAHANTQFDALASAKQSEIAAAKQTTADKTAELAETDENLANDRHDLALTEKMLSTDQAFLVDLNKRCSNQDAEFAKRSKARNEEIAAVGDAIGILAGDAARDLFSSTLGFVQRSVTRRAAVRVVQQSATRLDGFEKVSKAINKMTVDLKKQQADESGHRDFCIDEIRKNEGAQHEKEQELKDLEATIADDTATLETLTKEIEDHHAAVEEMTIQIKHASEDREAENKEFQQTIADQRATQVILQKAVDRLEQTYASKSLLQTRTAKGDHPGEFEGYEQNKGGAGVIGMIKEVMHEAATMETEAMADEQESQNAYTGFLKDTAASVAQNRKAITAKSEEKADREASLVAANAGHRKATETLANLKKFNSELHASCDFVMNNFDTRQEARAQEMDSLHSALSILSGA